MTKGTTRLGFLFSFLFTCAQPAFAISGNDWLGIGEAAQGFYILGVMDEWADAVQLCSNDSTTSSCSFVMSRYQPLVSCFANRTRNEAIAIVEKFMKDRPEKWNSTMASLVWTAISEVCKKP